MAEYDKFFFSPHRPDGDCDFSPVVRLAHDFPVAPSWRFFRKEVIGDHAIHFFLTGNGVYKLNGREYRISPGSLFVVRPGGGYSFKLEPKSSVRMLNIHFDLEDDSRFAAVYPCPDEAGAGKRKLPPDWPDFQEISPPERFCEVFFALLNAAGTAVGTAGFLLCKGLMIKILALLLQSADRPGDKEGYARDRILRTLGAVRGNLSAPHHLAGLAAEAGVSRSVFCEICRRSTGLTVRQYIERERIRRAGLLLLYEDHSQKEIAATCGFATVQHFCRVFKRHYQMSPGEFRRSHLIPDDQIK